MFLEKNKEKLFKGSMRRERRRRGGGGDKKLNIEVSEVNGG